MAAKFESSTTTFGQLHGNGGCVTSGKGGLGYEEPDLDKIEIKTRDQYIENFTHVVSEMIDLTRKKNNDYGGATDPWKNFREFGQLGILVRMSDKWARIKSALAEKRELKVSDETVEDTIFDLAVYSVILLLWIRSRQRGENE